MRWLTWEMSLGQRNGAVTEGRASHFFLPSYVHLQHVLFYPLLHITHPSRPSLLQRRQDAYSYGTWQHLWVRWWKTGKSSAAQLLSKYRVIQAICASSWLWLDKLRDWATIWGDIPESAGKFYKTFILWSIILLTSLPYPLYFHTTQQKINCVFEERTRQF